MLILREWVIVDLNSAREKKSQHILVEENIDLKDSSNLYGI